MKKKLILSLLSAVLFSAPTYPMADQIAQYYVFMKALSKGTIGFLGDLVRMNPELDRDWNQLYKEHNDEINDIDLAVQELLDTNKKNPYMFKYLGASSSAYQFEGGLDENSSVAQFYKKTGKPTAGKAIDFWNNYKEIIPEMKKMLGINSFRLSIAWDRVYTDLDTVNQNAVDQYKDIIKTLKTNDIEPIVVLHHYDVPKEYLLAGGFAKKENNKYFVNYAKTMYTALHEDVTYWSTFNALEGYAFKGYYTGDSAPGEKGNMEKTAQVIANMLNAHVEIYTTIKGQKGLYEQFEKKNKNIPMPQIGIQKNILPLDPARKTWKQWLLAPIARIFTCPIADMLQNEGFYGFFTNGRFRVYIPGKFKKAVYLENKQAPYTLDWIGVNHYANSYMMLAQRVKEKDPRLQTENQNYRFYPEGLSRAVKIAYNRIAQPVGKLKNKNKQPIPIFITENGIATKDDKEGNKKRKRFFKRTLYTITQLRKEGYPIIGYTPWASHDNFEWHDLEEQKEHPERTGHYKRYGFIHVDFENGLKRRLKEGSKYYAAFVKKFTEKIKKK